MESLVAKGADVNSKDDKGVSVTIINAAGHSWLTYTKNNSNTMGVSSLADINHFHLLLFLFLN